MHGKHPYWAAVAGSLALGLTAASASAEGAILHRVSPTLAPSTLGHAPAVDARGTAAIATWIKGGDLGTVWISLRRATRWTRPVRIVSNAYSAVPIVGVRDRHAVLTETASGIYLYAWSERTGRWIYRRLTRSALDRVAVSRIDGDNRLTVLVFRGTGRPAAPGGTFRVLRGSINGLRAIWTATARPLKVALSATDYEAAFDVGANGTVAVAWRNPSGNVQVTRASGTAPFERPLLLGSGQTMTADVAVNPRGDLAVAWATLGPDGWVDATAMMRTAGATTWPPLPATKPNNLAPFVAINNRRQIAVGGPGVDTFGVGEVRVGRLDSNGNWRIRAVPMGTCSCGPTIGRVLLDENGNTYVAGSRRAAGGDIATSRGFVTAVPWSATGFESTVSAPFSRSAVWTDGIALGRPNEPVVTWGRVHRRNAAIRVWPLRLS